MRQLQPAQAQLSCREMGRQQRVEITLTLEAAHALEVSPQCSLII